MPTYLDDDGLLRYWPSERLQGSPELTAYVLAITAANGFAIPEASKARMIAALQALVEGRLDRKGYGPYDIRLVRVAALAALARTKRPKERRGGKDGASTCKPRWSPSQ